MYYHTWFIVSCLDTSLTSTHVLRKVHANSKSQYRYDINKSVLRIDGHIYYISQSNELKVITASKLSLLPRHLLACMDKVWLYAYEDVTMHDLQYFPMLSTLYITIPRRTVMKNITIRHDVLSNVTIHTVYDFTYKYSIINLVIESRLKYLCLGNLHVFNLCTMLNNTELSVDNVTICNHKLNNVFVYDHPLIL